MKTLNNEEMLKINGGASKLVWGLIGGAIVFVIGIIEGIVNPKKCN